MSNRKYLLPGLLPILGLPAQAQKVTYIHTDALGSVVAMTDENRNVIERREYEPYGYQLTPAVQDGPGYTGHVQDAATGLVYMQQRYYDPGLGTMLSVDPVSVNATTAWNFCRYCYAAGNPYVHTDPDGREIRSTNPSNNRRLEQHINSRAKGVFRFDRNNQLQMVNAKGDASRYSSTYQRDLNRAIASDKIIQL